MKKVLSLVMVAVICLSMLLLTTSCALNHPMEQFKRKMNGASSYQITITITNFPLFGSVTSITKVDGNIQYTPSSSLTKEEYIETDGDVKYKYSKDLSGNWVKEVEENLDEDESTLLASNVGGELFDYKNYDEVKGEENTYQQKQDVEFPEIEGVVYSNVKMTITEDSCTMEMTATSSGVSFNMIMVLSHINEIELTLPNVD